MPKIERIKDQETNKKKLNLTNIPKNCLKVFSSAEKLPTGKSDFGHDSRAAAAAKCQRVNDAVFAQLLILLL